MDYVITTYPMIYRRYLIHNVKNEDEAWDKYFEVLPLPFAEDDLSDEWDSEIELATPELKIQYGLDRGGNPSYMGENK